MQLQYLNQADLPVHYTSNGHKVGGFTDITYDSTTDSYIAQSDFGVDGKPSAIYSFKFTGLYNSDGTPQIEFEKTSLDLSQIDNVESIRRDPKGDGFLVTTMATASSVYHYHTNGSLNKLAALPENIKSSAQSNKSLKNSKFSSDGSYYVAMDRNVTIDAAEYTRITKFNKDGNAVAQYAYYIGKPSTPDTTSNYISEILAVNNNQLLILEKENNDSKYSVEGSGSQVRIYEITLNNAQNILNIASLKSENITALSKNLIFDSMDTSIIKDSKTTESRFGNIQGMSFGPILHDGRASLVLVSDNSPVESQDKTQFVSYAIQSQYDSLQLHYLNQTGLSFDYKYTDLNGLTYRIGGLSGIDYDPTTDTYIVESDHQSIDGASLGYSVMYRIKLTGLTDLNGQPTVKFLSAQPLVNENGSPIYDVESIRFDPNGDGFWVTTEEKPAGIYHYHSDGSVSKIAVPDNIATRAQNNLSLEGSTFAPDGSYYVSMERNLTGDATGYSRITKYDANRNVVAQYAYYTDRPSLIDATSNGISEILALDNNTLLIMERGRNSNQPGVTEGVSQNRVRIYKVSLVDAQNVLNIENIDASNTRTMDKVKVFDSQDPSIINQLNTNETKIDNIEGMTLGPKLPDGRQSLILVSDNNFNVNQYKSQIISLVLDDGDACFLAGTFIRAQQGMVRVEDIMPGDLVYCLGHNNAWHWQLRQVTWTGKQTATVAPYKHDDLAGYPVCICRNAFEEGVPFADLYVTSEHCMFLNDSFVPIRMLVNGKTIFYDRSFTTYDYYHIELEKHSVIAANGALSESYLDTGNRHYFISKNLNSNVSSRIKSWDRDAAAFLITKKGNVKTIFDYLDTRADQMLIHSVEPKKPRTNNPDLYLIADNENKILPIKVSDKEVLFELPSVIKNIRLVSRTYRPCDVLGPFVDNRHSFGVLAGDIYLHQEYQKQVIDMHLSGADLSGWLPQFQSHARWTSGNAFIPLKEIESDKHVLLSIQILETGSYLVE